MVTSTGGRMVDLGGTEIDERGGPEADHLVHYGALEDLIDTFIEGFNAHDAERLLAPVAPDAELPGLGEDRAGLLEAVAGCWDARPHAILTRGVLADGGEHDGWEDAPVAVMWDLDEDGRWRRVLLLGFDVSDDDRLGLVEPVEEATLVDAALTDTPEDDVPEGAAWSEWDEGADRP